MSEINLTAKQQAAVDSNGRVLVSAGAGSGKTRVLTSRIIRLIKEGADIRDMLVVTFTNPAAAELKTRITESLLSVVDKKHSDNDKKLSDEEKKLSDEEKKPSDKEKKLSDEDKKKIRKQTEYVASARIGTYHNFCAHFLRENYLLADLPCNFKVLPPEHTSTLKLKAAMDTVTDFIEEDVPGTKEFIKRYSSRGDKKTIAKDILIPIYDYSRVIPDPEAWLDKIAAMTFEDLINIDYKGKFADVVSDGHLCDIAKEEFDHTLEDVRFIVKLVKAFELKYSEIKADRASVDFDDLLHKTYSVLLKKPKKYKYTFVDEYQDTNPIQSKLISLLSYEDSTFFVGDIKQSIYRFLHADPTIFLDTIKKFKDSGLLVMNENFRSSEKVINAVNDVMSRVMSSEVGDIEYTEDESLIPRSKNSGEVKILLRKAEGVTADCAAVEGEMIADKIEALLGKEIFLKDKTKEISYEDITVLVRSHKGDYDVVDGIKENLDKKGIPYCMTLSEKKASECAEIFMQMLKCVAESDNDIALLTMMRYPGTGFTDKDFADIKLWSKQKYGKDDNFSRCALRYMQKNDDDLAKKLNAFYEKISHLRLYARAYSLRDFLYYAADAFELFDHAKMQSEAEVKALESVIETILSCGERSLVMVIRYMEDYKATHECYAALSGKQQKAVFITTMHKSKGLEFPVVFLAGLSKVFDQRDTNGHTSIMRHKNLGLMPMYKDSEKMIKRTTLLREFAAERIRKDNISEELRILYVAMTRASNNLYLCSAVPKYDKKEEFWQELASGNIPYSKATCMLDFIMGPQTKDNILDVEFEESLTKNEPKSVTEPEEKINEPESCDFISFEKRKLPPAKISVSAIKKKDYKYNFVRSAKFDSNEDLTGAEFGTLIHSIMEKTNGDRPFEDIIDTMKKNYVITDEEYKKAQEFIPNMQAFLKSDVFRRIQNSDKVLREKAFCVKIKAEDFDLGQGEILLQGVIDLAFTEGDSWVLLDYKTDNITPANEEKLKNGYAVQLKLYADALEKITGKKVKEKILCFLKTGQIISI